MPIPRGSASSRNQNECSHQLHLSPIAPDDGTRCNVFGDRSVSVDPCEGRPPAVADVATDHERFGCASAPASYAGRRIDRSLVTNVGAIIAPGPDDNAACDVVA